MKKTMEEYKEGGLHSGSKHDPEVHSRAQAIAIGLSEERKEGHKVPEHKKTHHEGYEPHVEHEHSNHGHPGHHLRLKEEGHEFPEHSDPDTKGQFAKGVHGHPGIHMSMQTGKPHGFGHTGGMKQGHHRNSGHPGAHRIGGKKK